MQVLFIKWVLTVFDMIDAKDQLRAIYGFIFNFVTDENLVSAGDLYNNGLKWLFRQIRWHLHMSGTLFTKLDCVFNSWQDK